MKNLIAGILIVLAIGGEAARAEMRMWTDKKGNAIEAEFVKIIAGKVILKTPAGKQLKVPQSGLSNADQIFLANAIPPKIDIDVNIDKDSKEVASSEWGYSRRIQKIQGHVTLTKKNRDPSLRKFTAYLYIFVEDIREDEIRVLDKAKHEFSFEYQNKISFDGNRTKTEYTNNSYLGSEYGKKYDGYLVLVEDDKGKIVCVKGSRSLYEDKASQIKKAKKNSLLDNLDQD